MTMALQESKPLQVLSDDEIAERMAEVEKGQQLAGHFPDEDAIGRARRMLAGEISFEDALAEIDAKYPA